MHEIHNGSDIRLDDDYGISLPSVGQCLMLSVFSWARCGSIGVFLKRLAVSKLRTIFFVSWQYVIYIIWLFPHGDILDK